MGCSAVTIDGGSGDEMDSLPALFVANLEVEGGKCPTTASQDVLYPNPGKYVTTMSATNGKNWPKATPTGEGCGSGGSPAQPTGYGSGSSSEAAPSSSAYAQPTTGYGSPSQAAPTSVASLSSAVESYANQKGRESSTTFATLTSTQQQSVAAPTAEAPAPTGYSGSSDSESNSTSSGTPCSEDGALICIGSNSFGICDHGSAVSRPLASGTVCKDGIISGANRFRRHIHGAHKH
jgi:hypothetical protein